ncbi:S41 family peptidase [Massilia sp. 9I]|uniref:S41 family peptidase n=1 Tax=Massilia sp. 9I TaxID=2653152 RepID=UPI0012EF584F|nr:S41 family peptidase [Massilia sp. 9I]VXB51079.1 conserved exported hypothetical protein [Massilia sp. 9I]
MRFLNYLLTAASLLMLALPLAHAAEPLSSLGAAQFREDLAFIRKTIDTAHPDPGFSTDRAAVEAALERLGQDLPPVLSRDEAWWRLATLNPLFADAHFFIGYPDWRGEAKAWLAGGGVLFPIEVEIGPDGRLFVRSPERPRIISIDGVDAEQLVSTLLARIHGDTPAFRANLLAERWWFYYGKRFGAAQRYQVVLDEAGRRRTVQLPASRAIPRLLAEEADFASLYRLAIGKDGKAVLTVGSFSQPDPSPFLAFTRDAFARIRDAGVTELEIDVSRNGGGDDALWLDGLMPYLASRPYRTGSTYRARARAQEGAAAPVTDGEITTWRQPQPENPLRFGGKLSVRIGPATYSSAVLFANVMRDFGMARLIGAGGAARTTQSGGVRSFSLPHSGLPFYLPRFILDPPAGRVSRALLESAMP